MKVRQLPKLEQETIITFIEEEKQAYIFTYNKAWQGHLEQKLKLKPVYKNSCGGREYELSKKLIKMPRAPKNLSAEERKIIGERLHRNRVLSSGNHCTVDKTAPNNQNTR